ncbi:hypothetical protein ACP3PD_02675 [Enterobacter ludwigii]
MLLSKSAYARHMGVSRQTVYGWIARGEIVISGDKVDVDASQAKQNSAGTGEHQTEMTWAQAAAWVWGHDGGKELPADIDAGQRIEAAAAELGFDVQHEPDEQLLILFRRMKKPTASMAMSVQQALYGFFVLNWLTLPQCTPIRWMTGTKLV